MYKNSLSKVNIGKAVSEEIKVQKGLRQGCSISPRFFKIFIHVTLLIWSKTFLTMAYQLEKDQKT